jgi:hypothetical protein
MKNRIFGTLLVIGFLAIHVAVFSTNADASRSDVEAFVSRFYQLCLGRSPDQLGLDGWVTALLDGSRSGLEVAEGFVLSAEFQNQGTDNQAYLTILYEAFFNRSPDAGFAVWLAELNAGKDRREVLDGFIWSTEFTNLCLNYGISATPPPIKSFLMRFYRLCLHRDADEGGLNQWISDLENGVRTGQEVAQGFINSQEFVSRNVTNQEYVRILYQAFFNRVPAAASLADWVSQLEGGKSRHEVLMGFLLSSEFMNLCEAYGIRANSSIPLPGPPLFSGFDFKLKGGDFWEFQWDYQSSYVDSRTSSTKKGTGRFRITLGGATTIGGVFAHQVNVSGKSGYDDTSDFAPRWKYIAVANNQILVSEDGTKLVTLFDAQKGMWPGSGFFAALASDKLFTASQGTIDNDYITDSAIVIGRSSSESQCEYFGEYGTICGGDYNESDVHREYYKANIGPLGYYRYFSMSDYSWSSSTRINVGLVASSLRGDTLNYTMESEPNDSPTMANRLDPAMEMQGYASDEDEGYGLAASSETTTNSSWETAQTLTLPEQVEGDILNTDASAYIVFDIGNDGYYTYSEDWFMFTLDSNTYIDVNLNHDEISNGSLFLFLFNYTGSYDMGAVVAYNASSGATDTKERLYGNFDAGTYLIAVDYVPDEGQEANGQRVDYTLEVVKGSDSDSVFVVEDWYSFTSREKTSVTITLALAESTADMDLNLYNSGADRLLGISNTGGAGENEVIRTVLDPGTYMIGVNAVRSGSNYTLIIE